MNKSLKLMFFVTEDWYFCSHRLQLAIAAQNAGYEVSVVTRVVKHGDLIRSHGLNLIPIELSRRGKNPFLEFLTLLRLCHIYLKQRPDIVHHVAMKPVLYGSIAARLVGVPFVVNALAGLGFLFNAKSLPIKMLRFCVETAFRFLFNRRNTRIIFQNPDDLNVLVDKSSLSKDLAVLIKGSGVDLNQFKMIPESLAMPVVLLASRMLWDKGVGEFVEAARLLKQKGSMARFILVGEGDPENQTSIAHECLEAWHDEGLIEWLGRREDMPELLASAHIVCLPSTYGEGVPRVLIEAAACGRPIVTTDVPGCREIVQDGLNGFLIPAKDIDALVNALQKLLDDAALRRSMGESGRHLVASEFSIEYVNQKTLAVYQDLQR